MGRFKTASSDAVAQAKERAKILLVTATNVETEALHAELQPLQPHGCCYSVTVGNQTYYLGRLGSYGIIHVQCQMGSVLPGASESTVADAIAFWGVKAVVMVGIAFGVDTTKQRIGDVLISKTVIPYEVKRIGKTQVVSRGPIPPCGPVLLNRFSNGRGWDHPLPANQKARLLPAHMLSGESLIDNKYYRTRLLRSFPQGEGGEMEGVGVFAAAHQKGIEWILVKGICDFADGKKRKGKASKQLIAARSAASLCAHVFGQRETFEALGCTDLTCVPLEQARNGLTTEEVLFEVYDRAYERAYLERNVDRDIGALLNHQGLWITGPTGCGKTSALRRNLTLLRKPFHFFDLSVCVGGCVSDLFATLHLEIADRLGATARQASSQSRNAQSFHIAQIAKLLECNLREETYIHVDEIPVDHSDFRGFVQGIAAIGITLANRNCLKAPFLLASIADPANTLDGFQGKLLKHMRLLPLSRWPDAEMHALLAVVLKHLPVRLTEAQRDKIVTASAGCPRRLKIILKQWCLLHDKPGWPLERVISEFSNS